MKKILALLAVLLVPAISFGQAVNFQQKGLLDGVTDFINRLIPFIIGVAVLVFIFGLIKYVTAGGDPDKIKEARNTIILGIIIIFIMTSVWGLVRILKNTVQLDNRAIGTDEVPQIQ